jgi:hypothetical protein
LLLRHHQQNIMTTDNLSSWNDKVNK